MTQSVALIVGLIISFLVAYPALAQPAPSLRNVEFLEQFAATNRFRLGQPAAISITPDAAAVLFLRSENGRSFRQDLWMFDVSTKQEKLLLSAEQLLGGKDEQLTTEELARRERMRMSSRGIASYQLSDDGKRLLVPLSGRLFIVDYASAVGGAQDILELKSEAGSPIDPQFSPDGTLLAAVRDGEIYVSDIASGTQSQLTRGAGGTISHGEAEFVAQEEMGRRHGFWWSPDSTQIAFQRTDTSGIETFTIADASDPAKPAQSWPYPRAGTKNADVSLWVGAVHRRTNSTDATEFHEPVQVQIDWKKYPYLAKVVWEKHGPMTVLVQNRTQTEQVLYAVDAKTGAARELLRERDETWINIQDDVPIFLKDGSFLWMTEQPESSPTDGMQVTRWTLEHRSPTGQRERTILRNAFALTGILGVDEVAGEVYLSDAFHNPGLSVIAVPIAASNAEPREPGCFGESSQVGAIIDKSLSIWIRTVSSIDQNPRWEVMQQDKVIGTLQDKSEVPPLSHRLEFAKVDLASAISVSATAIHAAIIRPLDFDPSKKYPVLNFAYTGPGVNTVNANRRAYLLHQWFADQGFIVVTIDGRGTPRRGRAWERAIKNDMIEVSLQDQCNAILALCDKFPEMDRNRVGVSGWSYGGYFAAMATMRRPDVFKAGIAGAPVTDWRDYDTHYTERYLGMPVPKEQLSDGIAGNQVGYDASNVLTYCKDLSVPLLIIHGTADDNVYFTHSIKMADALTRAGNSYEFMPLSGQTHMVTQPALVKAINVRMAEFFIRHLGKPQ